MPCYGDKHRLNFCKAIGILESLSHFLITSVSSRGKDSSEASHHEIPKFTNFNNLSLWNVIFPRHTFCIENNLHPLIGDTPDLVAPQEVDENGSNNSQVVVIDKYSLRSVSIPNKFAQQHLPPIASGKSMILEFEDCDGNKFLMEVVHSNYGDYYCIRTGWERYKDQHKLESGDFISFSKKNDSYVIYS
ncbi:hypothetical protein RDI58_022498 [Solanum bulbocastanum]|uniref:TF-B3 domain-containing protein n=1 Tax=Solanum bulbocastanum TaxID=147425 RepID=A0AAN8T2S6_SOLBU